MGGAARDTAATEATASAMPPRAQSRRFAAIDIGTVTCRLLIADVDAAGLHELHRGYAVTNLGEGVALTGVLLPAAMARVDAQVARFMEVVASFTTPEHPQIEVIAQATSASRDARNSGEFVALLAARGIELGVIAGAREATLCFGGVARDFAEESLVVVDIGGGSTEVIAGVAGCDPAFVRSLNVGCRRVTDRFLPSDPPTSEELQAAHTWIASEMQDTFARVRALGLSAPRLVAVAGTATSVVAIEKSLDPYDSARVHKAFVPREVLDRISNRLIALPLTQRQNVIGLDPNRASVMVAGLLILQAVLDGTGQDGFTVSESDILQGIILEAAQAAFSVELS
ncbi:MAG: Ppx/GppA family phosphatase [Raoultibacter sp.]